MLARLHSYGLMGINGFAITVETDIQRGLQAFDVVGLPDAAVKESRERVRAAIKNSGLIFPITRITVNLAPADVKKEGPAYDLPIALGILAASGQIPDNRFRDTVIIGELSLNGDVKHIRGMLPIIISAREQGVRNIIIPRENLKEASCVEGINIYPVSRLMEIVDHLLGREKLEFIRGSSVVEQSAIDTRNNDLAEVKGQSAAKRALEIAAAGGHNMLMIGPPGSGKTMLARCLPGILPRMTFDEALEVTRIHSIAGILESGLLAERPFRAPHHTTSSAAIIGGGRNAVPGEISKAHRGVLFLDELPEYSRSTLEAMRQPLEDGFVMVTRVNASCIYPANFMLVCSMNPCPCGYFGSKTKECRCTQNEIKRYLGRVSGPLLDRIDIHIQIESLPVSEIISAAGSEPSAIVRQRVNGARARQVERYKVDKITCNSQLNERMVQHHCKLDAQSTKLLSQASESMRLSTRAFSRVIKVARTIADLHSNEQIQISDIAEAIQYRSMDRKYWG